MKLIKSLVERCPECGREGRMPPSMYVLLGVGQRPRSFCPHCNAAIVESWPFIIVTRIGLLMPLVAWSLKQWAPHSAMQVMSVLLIPFLATGFVLWRWHHYVSLGGHHEGA